MTILGTLLINAGIVHVCAWTRVKSTYETERTYVPDSARMNHRGVPMEELHPGHGRALSDATSMRSPSIKRDRIDVDNGVVAPITEDDRFIMIDDSSPPAYASAIADCTSIDRSW
uniref:Uncharacterized protein n=1 Tax=Plectus sambesii TaxID=2011161 RepID=A0A914V2Y0_9BILA